MTIPKTPLSLTISEEDRKKFKRFDLYLVSVLPTLKRTYIKKLFGQKKIISSFPLSLNQMPPVGARISVSIDDEENDSIKKENIPLHILYENEDIIFLCKPAGMITHPGAGHKCGTLLNALAWHCPDILKMKQDRPGIVHRLDKGTSGVMVVAKNESTQEQLISLFKEHRVERIYQALTVGENIPSVGTLDSTIGRHPRHRIKMKTKVSTGKRAVTHYKKEKSFGRLTSLECTLDTGRTHQIRVQLSELLGMPVLCDPLYGNPPQQLQRLGPPFQKLLGDYPHPLLHARVLGLNLFHKKWRFEVPPPQVFRDTLELGKETLNLSSS